MPLTPKRAAERDALGVDIYCRGDRALTAPGDFATWSGVAMVQGDLERRITSASLYHRPGYGAGLKRHLNRPITPSTLRQAASDVRAQLALEPRVTKIVSVSVQQGTATMAPGDSTPCLLVGFEVEVAGVRLKAEGVRVTP
jgi:hypothetical protein